MWWCACCSPGSWMRYLRALKTMRVGNYLLAHILHHMSQQLKYLQSVLKQWYAARMKAAVLQPFSSSAEGNDYRTCRICWVFFMLGMQSWLNLPASPAKKVKGIRGNKRQGSVELAEFKNTWNNPVSETIFHKLQFKKMQSNRVRVGETQHKHVLGRKYCCFWRMQ